MTRVPFALCLALTLAVVGCDKEGSGAAEEKTPESAATERAAPGADSVEARACANMIRLMQEGMPEGTELPPELSDVDICLGTIDNDLPPDCKDRDAAMTCMAEAVDLAALMECESHCTAPGE